MNPKFLLNSLIALSIASFSLSKSSSLSLNLRETDLSSGHFAHRDSTVKHSESRFSLSLTSVRLNLVLREFRRFHKIFKSSSGIIRELIKNETAGLICSISLCSISWFFFEVIKIFNIKWKFDSIKIIWRYIFHFSYFI